MRRIRIRLDLPSLVAHLSRDEKRQVSMEEALIWLKEAGFTRDGDYWIVAENDLGQVEPSEVLEAEPLPE